MPPTARKQGHPILDMTGVTPTYAGYFYNYMKGEEYNAKTETAPC